MTLVLVGALVVGVTGCGDDDAAKTTPAGPAKPKPAPAEPGPLAKALKAKADASAGKIPADVLALFQRAGKELANSGLAAKAANVGGKAPDFELDDPLGQTVSLAALRKRGPVVVAFYRGKW